MNKKRIFRGAAALVGAVALILALGACSAKAYASQCAFVVGNGVGDSRDVKDVLWPGEKVSRGDDEDFYIPCNARNYVITSDKDHGDRHVPVVAKTAGSADGKTPATPVNVFLSAYWTPNLTKDTLKQFYNRLCRKYACASGEPADESGGGNFAPSAGWNGMLAEVVGPAIDRAGTTAMTKFPPTIWNDASRWNGADESVAKAFQDAFAAQVRIGSQSGALNYFCGDSQPNGDGKTATCGPVTFTVESVRPVDQQIVDIYNSTVVQQQKAAAAETQKAANKARLDSAKAVYGPQAESALREQDAIAACAAARVTCVVSVGGGSVSPSVTAPAAR